MLIELINESGGQLKKLFLKKAVSKIFKKAFFILLQKLFLAFLASVHC